MNINLIRNDVRNQHSLMPSFFIRFQEEDSMTRRRDVTATRDRRDRFVDSQMRRRCWRTCLANVHGLEVTVTPPSSLERIFREGFRREPGTAAIL